MERRSIPCSLPVNAEVIVIETGRKNAPLFDNYSRLSFAIYGRLKRRERDCSLSRSTFIVKTSRSRGSIVTSPDVRRSFCNHRHSFAITDERAGYLPLIVIANTTRAFSVI